MIIFLIFILYTLYCYKYIYTAAIAVIVKVYSYIMSPSIRTHQIKHITVIDILLFSGSTITGNTIYLRIELFDNVKHDFYFFIF